MATKAVKPTLARKTQRSSKRMARLEVRISAEQKRVFEHAAALEGRSLSDFVVSSASEAANRTIEEREIIRLTVAQSRRFVELLLNPPKPNAYARRAARRYKRVMGIE